MTTLSGEPLKQMQRPKNSELVCAQDVEVGDILTRTCSIRGCPGTVFGRGWCRKHYGRWQRHGDPEFMVRMVGISTSERILRSIAVDSNGCWLWQRCIGSNGYPSTNIGGKTLWAHRVSYEAFVGPIPKGLELDHLCRTPACVNPGHLEIVTHTENLRRVRGQKTHCKNGHPLSSDNLFFRKKKSGVTQRLCKICLKASNRRYEARKRSRGQSSR